MMVLVLLPWAISGPASVRHGCRYVLQRYSGLIDNWSQFDVLICIDAAASISAPGSIHRIDVRTVKFPRELALVSSHTFGLADVIALARELGLLPRTAIIYAIEGVSFSPGEQ